MVFTMNNEHWEGYDMVIVDELVRVAEDPGMGANRVGHLIEVVRPHVDVILILAESSMQVPLMSALTL